MNDSKWKPTPTYPQNPRSRSTARTSLLNASVAIRRFHRRVAADAEHELADRPG
jgi:hypothetical protein